MRAGWWEFHLGLLRLTPFHVTLYHVMRYQIPKYLALTLSLAQSSCGVAE
jgi:hypothetical protein